jgi:predicted RNA methylase
MKTLNWGGSNMIQVKSKWLASVVATILGFAAVVAQAEAEMKPFILGSTSGGVVADKVADVKKSLQDNGFEIAGDYSPYETAHIIVVTNGALKKAAASHDRAGYVAAQRVSITKVGDQVQVSYTNPPYMAAAYHVESDLSGVSNALKAALGAIKEYGPEDGMTVDDLNGYHYTFGMEYFDEPYELASYSSHKDAIAAIEKGLAAGAGDTAKVYRIDIPGTKQTIFGVGMAASANGNKYMDDDFIMTEIDFKETRSTAHLPYEVLVNGGDVEALHARFRIAMNFPDLSMMGSHSFMNIMPSPDAIRDALTKAVGGNVSDDW